MHYFKRMADIEKRFYGIWKDLALNDKLSLVERSKLSVWDYPITDKYTKLWQRMQDAGLPKSLKDAVERVRSSKPATAFAFLGDATDIKYLAKTNCDLQYVGDDFSRKPYAIAVQQGSHLKDIVNNAYVFIYSILQNKSHIFLCRILTLLNRRELEKLRLKWWAAPKGQNCDDYEDQTEGISVEDIGGVFVAIFVGIAVACMTLIFQYVWYKKYRTNPKVIDVSAAAFDGEVYQTELA